MEHRSYNNMSLSKKKNAKKEGDSKQPIGEVAAAEAAAASMAVAVAAEEKRRRDVSSSNIEVNNTNTTVVGVDHHHDNEEWRAWLKPWMLVDEQMSWGSVWYSFWDVDDNCLAYYGDVLEDDLWNLRSIQHTPQ